MKTIIILIYISILIPIQAMAEECFYVLDWVKKPVLVESEYKYVKWDDKNKTINAITNNNEYLFIQFFGCNDYGVDIYYLNPNESDNKNEKIRKKVVELFKSIGNSFTDIEIKALEGRMMDKVNELNDIPLKKEGEFFLRYKDGVEFYSLNLILRYL